MRVVEQKFLKELLKDSKYFAISLSNQQSTIFDIHELKFEIEILNEMNGLPSICV